MRDGAHLGGHEPARTEDGNTLPICPAPGATVPDVERALGDGERKPDRPPRARKAACSKPETPPAATSSPTGPVRPLEPGRAELVDGRVRPGNHRGPSGEPRIVPLGVPPEIGLLGAVRGDFGLRRGTAKRRNRDPSGEPPCTSGAGLRFPPVCDCRQVAAYLRRLRSQPCRDYSLMH